jgi:hypothetical protein
VRLCVHGLDELAQTQSTFSPESAIRDLGERYWITDDRNRNN